MGIKISAVQAALLIGRNERRVRDWIATQRLPAIKVGQSWQIDTEDLERLPGVRIDREQLALLQAQETSTFHDLLYRIAELERVVEGLHAGIVALSARLDRLECLQAEQSGDGQRHLEVLQAGGRTIDMQGYPSAYMPANLGPDFSSYQDTLPSGSIRVKQFSLIHKVHAAVLAYQIETGKIEDTQVSAANGRKGHWLTPKQQMEVIAFWRRNGTRFTPCSVCPHNGHGE